MGYLCASCYRSVSAMHFNVAMVIGRAYMCSVTMIVLDR